MSKLAYRASAFNLRVSDNNKIQSQVKAWINQGLLLKTPELMMFRKLEEGGLGLVHTGARCTANLIKTFIEQGHNKSRYPNLYLNTLYRCYVTGELEKGSVKRP